MTLETKEGFEIAPQQRYLFLLNQIDGLQPQRVRATVSIEGDLDQERLKAAVDHVVGQFDIFRTRYPQANRPQPQQVVADSAWSWEDARDLTAISDRNLPAEIETAAAETVDQPMDLENGPLFRSVLLTLGKDRYQWLISGSALSTDRVSMALLVDAVAKSYSALTEGQEHAIDGLQYAGYAAWQRDLLSKPSADRAFWQSHQEPTFRAVQAARERVPDVRVFQPAAMDLTVDAALQSKAEAVATTCGTNAARVWEAVWRVFLWRMCDKQDYTLGVFEPGRGHEDLAHAMGCFAKNLPLYLPLADSTPFEQLVRDAATLADEASSRQHYFRPAALVPNHDRPRFDDGIPFRFDWVDQEPDALAAAGVTFALDHIDERDTPFKLKLAVRPSKDTTVLRLTYDAALFDSEDISRFGGHLQTLAVKALAETATEIGHLPLLTDGERTSMLKTFNPEPSPFPSDQAVHQLIEACAAAAPEAKALINRDGAWTYAELNAFANRLAHHLIELGVTRDTPVPVCASRGFEMIGALLAVWKAGGAYVPLDPDYPKDRVSAVLKDVEAEIILTDTEHMEAMSAFDGRKLLIDGAGEWTNGSDENPGLAVEPTQLAYVIYTSGTTGMPNGVMIQQQGLVNYLNWAVNYYDLKEGDGALLHSSIAYDLTVTSLWGPLVAGNSVHLLPESGGVRSVAVALGSGKPYTLAKLTPTHLRALNQMFPMEERASKLKVLVMGGEELHREALSYAREHAANARFVNEYGPTETVVGSTAYTIPMDATTMGRVSIGTPIANTRIYILDSFMEPVPIGVTGEIYIGGAGLARGYYKRPDLSSAKFVKDPFRDDDARLYRSGDLGRYLPDGQIEYLGRTDHQVKIRGFRVEPEEIESALAEHPGVSQVVVLPIDQRMEGLKLAAFVVPKAGGADQDIAETESKGSWRPKKRRIILSTAELHSFLRDKLPLYMMPSSFVLMDQIPLLPNGKVNRKKLAELDAEQLELGTPYVAPENEMQETLSKIWMKVLSLDRVGIDDDYFAVGGDSIRSINIAGEAQVHNLSISVGDVHKYPTIREMSEKLTDKTTGAVEVPESEPFCLIPKEDKVKVPDDVEDAYPLVLLQEGMIYHRAFAAKSAVYHAMLSLKLKAPFDPDVMREVVQGLVDRHPLLRTAFDLTTYSQPLQLVFRHFKDPLQYDDLTGLSEEEQQDRVEDWMEEEKKRGFEVDEFPLIRFMVHRLGEDVFILTFSYHHEIIDGWSEAMMVSELLNHYLSIMNGKPEKPALPTATFRDSVYLEQQSLKSDDFQEFWGKEIQDATLMRLPRLISGPKADRGERYIVKLSRPFPRDLSDRVKRLALATKVPVKSVLLAAHMRVMMQFGGHSDVLTHMVSNGRPEIPGGDSVIGLFVNSFTFRQKLRRCTWRQLIRDTFRREQETWPYRRFPMAELKRHQGRDALAECLFFLIDYHVYQMLDKWKNAELLDLTIYGESTFPFCATFRANPFTSNLEMQVEYDALQFSEDLIEDMIACYEKVIQTMTDSPDSLYHNIPLLSKRESGLMMDRWNRTDAAYDKHATVHGLIEAQAASKPAVTAVAFEDRSLDYAELNRRANQLADLLMEKGVTVEQRVPIFMERSLEMVVAILGVLKAGATYVPLDPSHQAKRLDAIVGDIQPELVLTQPKLVDQLPGKQTPHLAIDDTFSVLDGRGEENPNVAVDPGNLVYVIYTSGSTGNPKGVEVTHGNLVNSTQARERYYKESIDTFLLLSSFAFDSSKVGIYWTLCMGGTLVLPREGVQLDPNALMALITRHQVTHTLCIPSLYASLLEMADTGPLANLQTVIMAGEVCPKEVFEKHKEMLPQTNFYNEYGPTEATVWSTVWKGGPLGWKTQLPIGRPVANTRTYILDAFGLPVPIGVAGELYVGGDNLVRCYGGDAAKTASSFIPNAFSGQAGQRLYRTGDMARYLPDGDIEFLNRTDYQIKVRGFRIEPAEIETVLDEHPEVKRSVVLAREDQPGDKQLIAYILPRDKAPKNRALQNWVKEKLPKYMYPSSYVILEKLPLTATGKLDHKALPAPERKAGRTTEYVAPRSPTEEVLQGIWKEVLSVDEIGVHDDFYDLGGESLRGMRILSKISKAFNVNLNLPTLFDDKPTIAGLAESIEAAVWASKEAEQHDGAVVEGDL